MINRRKTFEELGGPLIAFSCLAGDDGTIGIAGGRMVVIQWSTVGGIQVSKPRDDSGDWIPQGPQEGSSPSQSPHW
jgi:hypothetical protein